LKILLTGASGFVGSHALRHLLVNTDWDVVCPVTFSHKGLPARIASAVCDQPEWARRVEVVHWDMRSLADPITVRRFDGCQVIWNIASESHVDRSIETPGPFIRNNVDLMLSVMELARQIRPSLVLQMSTDEVYGPAPEHYSHREWDVILPSNPYSASKAAQEAIGVSYWRTYGVPLVITNTMNIIGEMQDPEKFLPKIVRHLRDRQPIPVHVSPEGVPGSRHYLHARNLADAWLFLTGDLIERVPMYPAVGRPYRVNIVGEREVSNTEMVGMVSAIMGLPEEEFPSLIEPVSFHSSRPGHDLRYALDGSRLARLGWHAPVPLAQSVYNTVKWTLEHPEWLDL
jgi:dTDP-glucose 4,6-dehydratase